jgi:hypothetical protein
MHIDPMHAARLAQLEGAMCALLREQAAEHEPNDMPDGIVARLTPDGLDIEYLRGPIMVSGEGV